MRIATTKIVYCGRRFNPDEVEKVREVLAKDGRWKEWRHPKDPQDVRWYWNPTLEDLGIEIERYRSGNIKFFAVHGKRWSNSAGRDLMWVLSGARIWFSENDGSFAFKVPGGRMADAAAGLIERALRERVWPALRKRGIDPEPEEN